MNLKDLKKLKIGIANFMMIGLTGKETEELAFKSVDNARKCLESLGVETIIPLPAVGNLEDARTVVKGFKNADVDAVVVCAGTFTLGFPVAEVIRNTNLPMLVWAFEESRLIEDGLPAFSLSGLMDAATTMVNMGKRHSFIYGEAHRDEVRSKVKLFIDAVRAISYMRTATIGLFGSRPDGFEFSGFDEYAIKDIFGTTISKVSMSELLDTIDSIDESDVEKDLEVQKEIFNTGKCTNDDLKGISRVYLGVKNVVNKYNLQGFAPQCWPELRVERKTPICPANGRLTADGIMASCEADMDGALTMLFLYYLCGNTPWTLDLVTLNRESNALLFWHCGNASHNLSDKKPVIETVCEGPAQTATLRKGKVTVCRINHLKGNFEIFAGIGEATGEDSKIRGSSILVKMQGGNMEFVNLMQEKGICHHVIIIYGDLSKELKEAANLMGLPLTLV